MKEKTTKYEKPVFLKKKKVQCMMIHTVGAIV
jgi:hypothetical protein